MGAEVADTLTMEQYAAHYKAVADQYRAAAFLIRGDLTAWKHERNVQVDGNGDPSPDFYRADGAINAINHLASKADLRRETFAALAAAADRGDKHEMDKLRNEAR